MRRIHKNSVVTIDYIPTTLNFKYYLVFKVRIKAIVTARQKFLAKNSSNISVNF
jgi:hypothetical protein